MNEDKLAEQNKRINET